jgi:hypothetical protein
MADQNVHVVKPHNFQGYLEFETNEAEKSKLRLWLRFAHGFGVGQGYIYIASHSNNS